MPLVCNENIFYTLIVTDADNDEVRCRWAKEYEECGDICGGHGIPNALMHFVSLKRMQGPAGLNPGARCNIGLLESENFSAA